MFPVTKFLIEQKHFLGFPGGSMVKNPPPNAGDVSTIPEPARSHMLWSNEAHTSQVLSLCPGDWDPQLKPMSLRVCAPQQEKPPQ